VIHHIVVHESKTEKHNFRAFCETCFTEGRFVDVEPARAFAQLHKDNMRGINSAEIDDQTLTPAEPEPVPVVESKPEVTDAPVEGTAR
jgi:hypothetical protein